MWQGFKNLHKLFSKRYFVLFFDKKNMPEEGTFINIGELSAQLKKDTPKLQETKPEENV
jgi:hypothetical protein